MRKNLPWFALIALLSVLMWQFVFSVVCAPKKQESLQIFVTAASCDTAGMEARLAELPVRQIHIFSQNASGSRYNDYLRTVGILDSDLLILDSTVFTLENAWQEFAPLDAEMLSGYGLDPQAYSYLSVQECNYAIVVYDARQGIALFPELMEVCRADRQYCIVVNRNTPNSAPYSQGENTTDHAFRALAMLLKDRAE